MKELSLRNDNQLLREVHCALVMICEKDEEPQPSAAAHCKVAMTYSRCKAMDTRCL